MNHHNNNNTDYLRLFRWTESLTYTWRRWSPQIKLVTSLTSWKRRAFAAKYSRIISLYCWSGLDTFSYLESFYHNNTYIVIHFITIHINLITLKLKSSYCVAHKYILFLLFLILHLLLILHLPLPLLMPLPLPPIHS